MIKERLVLRRGDGYFYFISIDIILFFFIVLLNKNVVFNINRFYNQDSNMIQHTAAKCRITN